ncbi:MAG: hypothetical protein IT391_12315 [Nitrospira sp.]|nr:hypothetical protein [Nitrospira sp.]
MNDDPTPDSLAELTPQWYRRTGWCFFGNMYVHTAFAILHVVICLAPLVLFLICGVQPSLQDPDQVRLILLWVCIAALGYPTWAWIETMVFERWVRRFPEAQRKVERAHYQLHVGMAKNFWQAVMQMYTVAGLIGIAMKATGNP